MLFIRRSFGVKRLSDSVDTIPVLISEQIADITKSRVGEFAEIYGEFHSHNLREENHTRLELYVFAREVKFVEVNDSKTDYTNRILLEGTICKPTVYRKTPLKKKNYGSASGCEPVFWKIRLHTLHLLGEYRPLCG